MAPSALRYYESQGLIEATRTPGGARRYPRTVLRRLAVIRAARNVGLTLPEIRAALGTLPDGRPPTVRDWARLSQDWRDRPPRQKPPPPPVRGGVGARIGGGRPSLGTGAPSHPRGTPPRGWA